MSLDVGSRVSQYRLVRRLGTGGMGDVFLAEDTQLDRLVAIKFLIGPRDDHARKRLLHEARAVAALDHPGICRVYEIGHDPDGGDFIVMQHVEGETLGARLQRGRLSPAETFAIGARIADALETAHGRGIVHRDLKPQNVMLTPAGEPRLLDFGLAKRLPTTPAAAEAKTVTKLTQPYAVMGTPGFMSPEQVRGLPADARSDLFSLGCLLYECLAGRHAFGGSTPADVAADVLQRTPPAPSSFAPGIDPAHDAIVARLMEKAPEDRFQSAAEAGAAMRALVPGTGTHDATTRRHAAVRPRWWSRRAAIGVGLLALVVAVVAAAIWQPWRSRLPDAPPNAADWYRRGVEALREGTYATARTSLEEAVRLYDAYVLAYLRLAEAHNELDDSLRANEALVRADSLMPAGLRLTREQQLRFDAVRNSVMRSHDAAIAAYRQLAERHATDAGAWLDLGRAEEAADRRQEALKSYERALALNSQYAPAHVRFGTLRAQTGQARAGLVSLEEAARLYQAAGHTEGEAEALQRKGEVLMTSGANAEARAAFERSLQLAGDKHPFHRVRARFALARLTAVGGDYAAAVTVGQETVMEAVDAGLHPSAASGLVNLAYSLTLSGQHDAAGEQLERAIALATKTGARRAEMRATLQLAALRVEQGRAREAIALAEAPLRYYAEQRSFRVEADGKSIVSRALEQLEEYGEAARLATEALRLAESTGDEALVADSLENLAGQLTSQGRLPEALAQRERIEKVHRDQKSHGHLAFDLPNRAELLIRLGRGADALPVLDELDQRIAEGIDAYIRIERRVSVLRALLATTERRFEQVVPLARAAAGGNSTARPTDRTARLGAALLEHAQAQLGQSRTPIAAIAQMPGLVTSPTLRRELSYWAAQTLLARRDYAGAYGMAVAVWSEPVLADNPELRWRLAAVAGAGPLERYPSGQPDGATIRAHAQKEIDRLTASWADDAAAYLARPDLAWLRARLRRN